MKRYSLVLALLFFTVMLFNPVLSSFAAPTPTPIRPTPTPTKKPTPTPTPIPKPTAFPTTAPLPTKKPPAIINPVVSPAPQSSIVVKAVTVIIKKAKNVISNVGTYITNNFIARKKQHIKKKMKKITTLQQIRTNARFTLPPPKKSNMPIILNQ